jgi:hypothetical protein
MIEGDEKIKFEERRKRKREGTLDGRAPRHAYNFEEQFGKDYLP